MEHVVCETASSKPSLQFLGLPGQIFLLLNDPLSLIFLLYAPLLGFFLLLLTFATIYCILFITAHSKVIFTFNPVFLLLRDWAIGKYFFL